MNPAPAQSHLASPNSRPAGNQEGKGMRWLIAKLRGRFGAIALCLSIGAFLAIVSRYDVCFQNSETVCGFVPHRLKNGNGFTWKDFPTAIDVWGSDGASRPRYVSAYADIVTTKSRLALWDYVLPHPTFTPLWALTVVLATVLLYRFLVIATDDRQTALVGAALYLVSPGLLSSCTMMFHSGKPLANVVVIAALWLSARLERHAASGSRLLFRAKRDYAGLFLLLLIAPFTDETAAFAYFVPLVWCRSLFWPTRTKLRAWLANALALALPAVATAGLMFWVLPHLTAATINRHLDVAGYLRQFTDTNRFSLPYLLWTAANLLAEPTMPGAFDGIDVPVRWRLVNTNHVDLSTVGVAIGSLLIAGATWLMRRHKDSTSFFKLEMLTGIFILFQATVLLCHVLLLVAPGYYYGAIFSILFSCLAALFYARLRSYRPVVVRLAAIGFVLFIGTVSVRNFLPINASWMSHENYIGLESMQVLRFYERQGDWAPLKRLYPGRGVYYAHDAARQPGETPLRETKKIWDRWKQSDPQLLEGVVHIREFWIAQELTMKTAPLRPAPPKATPATERPQAAAQASR